jgi:hypothetical protein
MLVAVAVGLEIFRPDASKLAELLMGIQSDLSSFTF